MAFGEGAGGHAGVTLLDLGVSRLLGLPGFRETLRMDGAEGRDMAVENLTDGELQSLTTATTKEQWERLCNEIKGRRGEQYPGDWYEKVLAKGLHYRFMM